LAIKPFEIWQHCFAAISEELARTGVSTRIRQSFTYPETSVMPRINRIAASYSLQKKLTE